MLLVNGRMLSLLRFPGRFQRPSINCGSAWAARLLWGVLATAGPGVVQADESGMSQFSAFEPAWTDQLPLLLMQLMISAWIFVLGACFGSFLNVVIYRLPAGMSLGKPKSRCPRCETPLAARDNVPVFGWLALRGKCRYCSLPIAARYPLIEAVCGSLFIALMFGELLTGAANLPGRHPDHFHVSPGFWLVWFTKWDLLGIYLFHCSLMIIVLATVMIGYDGHPVQKKLTAFGWSLAIIAGTLCGELRPVPAYPWPAAIVDPVWSFTWTDAVFHSGSHGSLSVSLAGLLDGLVGAVMGTLIGRIVVLQGAGKAVLTVDAGSVGQRKVVSPVDASVAASFSLIGAFLGWQACGMLAVIVLPLLAVIGLGSALIRTGGLRRSSGVIFFALLLAFLFCWRFLEESTWMIGSRGWDAVEYDWRVQWAVVLVVLVLFSLLASYGHDKFKNPEKCEDFEG